MLGKISTVFVILTALIHYFVGGVDGLAPMLAADFAPESSTAMRAFWQLVIALLFWSVLGGTGGIAVFNARRERGSSQIQK